MTGEAIVAKLINIEAIDGADRIKMAKIYGETVIISTDYNEGDVGVLFDCETQLSKEYASENNLFRHKEYNKDTETVGYLDDNRRVRPIRLKGIQCSGLWMPLTSLAHFGPKLEQLAPGFQFQSYQGTEICKKFVRVVKKSGMSGNQGKAKKADLVPTFNEHIDTDQFMRNTHRLVPGALITITEKLHGTSCRAGNLPVEQSAKWWQKLLRIKPRAEYGHVVGSRRVVKTAGDTEVKGASYYSTDVWTQSAEVFKGKLEKGETVYYEILGYLPSEEGNETSAIMGSQSNDKLKKFMDKKDYKDFVTRYGETTVFSYGCQPGEYKIAVYRMTLQSEDGHVVDYTWDQVKGRCEKMDVPTVPQLLPQFVMDSYVDEHYSYEEHLKATINSVETLASSSSTNFPTQLREGVVVRIDEGTLTPKFLKAKSYLFKVLEGIIKDNPDAVNMEEDQSE